MSTRAQVYIKDTGVFLYQHSDGYNLARTVKNVIARGERLDDVEYLTRIIFSEMIKDHIEDSIGYGIGTEEHGDIEYLIIIDCDKKTMVVFDVSNKEKDTYSFDEFSQGVELLS